MNDYSIYIMIAAAGGHNLTSHWTTWVRKNDDCPEDSYYPAKDDRGGSFGSDENS